MGGVLGATNEGKLGCYRFEAFEVQSWIFLYVFFKHIFS